MSKEKSITVFNTAKHIRSEQDLAGRSEEQIKESCEKVAISIGLQLLKRKLIKFETDENPGANAGEKQITIKGSINILKDES